MCCGRMGPDFRHATYRGGAQGPGTRGTMAKMMETQANAPGAAGPAEISAHVKAHILAEALPNMLRYDEETVVIKFGGHAMGD